MAKRQPNSCALSVSLTVSMALLLVSALGCRGVEKPSSASAKWSPALVERELMGNDQLEESKAHKPVPLAIPSARRYSIAERPSTPRTIGRLNVPLGRKWYYIVVHHSGSTHGSASEINDWHKQRGWLGVGYHFVIGNGNGSADGAIEATFRWQQQIHGAHAGSKPHNEHGIGICMIGDFGKSYPTDKQMASLVALVDYLQDRCKIPTSHILLHRHIKSTECPGKNFPFYQFVSLLEH